MKTITRRLLRLEERLGLADTAERRRDRELVETLLRRRAARLAPAGLPEASAEDREKLSGLTMVEILQHGRQRARQAAIEAEAR